MTPMWPTAPGLLHRLVFQRKHRSTPPAELQPTVYNYIDIVQRNNAVRWAAALGHCHFKILKKSHELIQMMNCGLRNAPT